MKLTRLKHSTKDSSVNPQIRSGAESASSSRANKRLGHTAFELILNGTNCGFLNITSRSLFTGIQRALLQICWWHGAICKKTNGEMTNGSPSSGCTYLCNGSIVIIGNRWGGVDRSDPDLIISARKFMQDWRRNFNESLFTLVLWIK